MSKAMKIISHRGNLSGPMPEHENQLPHIWAAAKAGFMVEIDVWFVDGWLFGHELETAQPVSANTIHSLDPWAWFHAKNIEAMERLRKIGATHYFFHQADDIALTSCGKLWTFSGKELTNRSIACLPENVTDWETKAAFGVCTDYPFKYR